MPLSKKPNKNGDNQADSRQNHLTISTDENLASGYVPQAQTQGNVSPTSAGATGASVELAIPTVDLSETPPCASRFGHQNGNDEIFPIIDLCQTPQDDDVILISETNEVVVRSQRRSNSISTVSGQASNNDVQRTTRPRRRRTIDDQSSIRNAPSSLHHSRSPLSVTAKKLNSPVPFACPICLESTVQREPTSTRCGHVYCQSCILQAMQFNRKCPTCKATVVPKQLRRIYL
uniref:RING-type domain-containing protein n=1 Tax=Glossina austeni TaxID=7395 RepID=A0A1A9UGM2_GLOAU